MKFKRVSKEAYFRVQPDRKLHRGGSFRSKKGDVVIIAGKGHEQYQILKNTIIPFDDREVVRQALQNNILLPLKV